MGLLYPDPISTEEDNYVNAFLVNIFIIITISPLIKGSEFSAGARSSSTVINNTKVV